MDPLHNQMHRPAGRFMAGSIAGILLLALPVLPAAAIEDRYQEIETYRPMTAPNFRLQDAEGQWHELYQYADQKAIVLFVQGNGCPIVRQSLPYLAQIRDQFAPKGVKFLYINTNDFDQKDTIAEEAEEYSVDIPILDDDDQAVGRLYGFERTAEVIVLNPKDWSIVYRGSMDDRFEYGLQRMSPSRFYLHDTLTKFLGGEEIDVHKRNYKGCLIDLAELPEDVSYQGDVAPILSAHFADCFARNAAEVSESDARKWEPTLSSILLMKHIPAGVCGDAPKDVSLSRKEIRTLLSWLKADDPLPENDQNL